MRLKDTDKLVELIDDDIASLDKNMSQEGYDVCLCTLEMVKQYIKALPTVELKPIVIDGEEYLTGADYNAYLKGYKDGRAEPVKHGRWINVNEGKWNTIYVLQCSACGEIDSRMYLNDSYCPHCGARMSTDGMDGGENG